jgi:hypothetical protein
MSRALSMSIPSSARAVQLTQGSPAEQSSVDSFVEYLILEVVRYYSVGQDLVAAVHAVETMGFRIGFQLAER